MAEPSVPVDESVATLAQRIFWGAVLLPTAIALAVGFVAKVVYRAARGGGGPRFGGVLSWVIVIGAIQLAIVAWGRRQYFAGVKLRAAPVAEPARAEPGIFRHDTG